MHSITKKRKWGKRYIYAHVYYNPIKAVRDRENLFRKVSEMHEKAIAHPEKYLTEPSFCRYLYIKQNCDGFTVEAKQDVLTNSIKHSGWLVIISNHIKNATDAIKIYRSKDVVEKGFLKIKNNLDLGRLRVHSDSVMQSKVFVCFIALILLSYVHNIMSDNDLYKRYTMRQLMRVLSKLRSQRINDIRIDYPLTKEQREIYKIFDI